MDAPRNRGSPRLQFTKEELAMLKKSCEQLPETAYPDDFWLTVEKIYGAANEN